MGNRDAHSSHPPNPTAVLLGGRLHRREFQPLGHGNNDHLQNLRKAATDKSGGPGDRHARAAGEPLRSHTQFTQCHLRPAS